jgi:aminoglycoside phosphotransferase (APT) family kinase protein
VSDELEAALSVVLDGAEITGLRRLTAGASRETWAFDADGRALVLRRDPPEVPRPVEVRREAECFRAAARAGVPIPTLVASGEGDAVGSPYLIMERLDGETLPPRLLREERYAGARADLARELGRTLARLHAIPPAEVPSLEAVDDPLARLRAEHDAYGEPRPALEVAFRRLSEHLPSGTERAVVHGDFRNGNLLVGEDGLRAVLDWELAHLGDPREDLGWLCLRAWRFGAAEEVGGFGSVDELLDGYAELAERPDPAAVRWWELYACVHWAVICRMQAERHLGGSERSMEMAVLGRRVVEAEYDALLAMGLVDGSLPAADPVPAAGDRPTVGELLDAVSGALDGELEFADDRSAYLARVARTGLGIVAREVSLGPDLRRQHAACLADAGCPDDAALAAGLREGSLDPDDGAVAAAVRSSTLTRLVVANPRYPNTRPRR